MALGRDSRDGSLRKPSARCRCPLPAGGQIRRPAQLPEPDASSHVDGRQGQQPGQFSSLPYRFP
jgi:hypothetical protein